MHKAYLISEYPMNLLYIYSTKLHLKNVINANPIGFVCLIDRLLCVLVRLIEFKIISTSKSTSYQILQIKRNCQKET